MFASSMAAPPPDAPQHPTSPSRLTGWKEIAAYLNRGVRTVQRWEKEFGLPVRRLGGAKAESVSADPREIDAWLESAEGFLAKSVPGAAAASALPGADEAAAKPSRTLRADGPRRPAWPWSRKLAAAGAALACVAAVTLAIWNWRPAAGRNTPAGFLSGAAAPVAVAEPAEWIVDVDTLVALDARGKELWRHQFPSPLEASAYAGLPERPKALMGGVADVEGDGAREVWFVSHPAGADAAVGTRLHLFEHDGRLRWSYQPSGTVNFGADTFGPNWHVDRAYVTANPGGRPGRALWAVSYHLALFPSSVQRLDPKTGAPLGTYWSNGFVTALALGGSDDRPLLFVGAANNEHKAASLAVLDARNPNGSAPAENVKYRCTSCAPSEWPAFVVFPRPARFSGPDRSGGVQRIQTIEDGGAVARVIQGWTDTPPNAVAIFTLGSDLEPTLVDTADGYAEVYRRLVEQNLAAPGAPDRVDAARECLPLLRWDPSARRFERVSLSKRPEGSAPSR